MTPTLSPELAAGMARLRSLIAARPDRITRAPDRTRSEIMADYARAERAVRAQTAPCWRVK